MDFAKLKPALVLKRMPKNGANKSEDINDFIEQTLHDVASLYNFVNTAVIPAFNGLGMIGTWDDIDPITYGIDGSTVMSDRDFSDTSSTYFYDSSKGRPKTVFESLSQIINDLNQAYVKLNEVQARLGTAPDDAEVPTSQATLSEIETKVNYLNGLVLQIRNSNDAYLTASEIASGIEDNSINPASFNIIDVDISGNAAINPIKISGIDLTASLTYTGGLPSDYDIKDSVLRIKEWVEDLTGETFVEYSGTNKTPSSDYKTHLTSSGTGAVSSTNPHGLDISDLSDLNSLLSTPQLLAEFDVKPSGLATYFGGYSYVPYAFTITSIALTLEIPGSTGITAEVWKRSGGGDTLISGLTVAITPTPGSAQGSIIGQTLTAGDMLFVSGVSGDGLNAKMHVFGRP